MHSVVLTFIVGSFQFEKFLGTLQSRILELDWTEVQVGSEKRFS